MSLLVKPINENSSLVGAEQVCFAASHIALILGASEIVYLGFDHKSPDHFYSYEPYKSTIKKQIKKLKEEYHYSEFAINDINDFININVEPNSIPEAYSVGDVPEFFRDYEETKFKLNDMFKTLGSIYGLKFTSLEENSIITEAGATLKKIEDFK